MQDIDHLILGRHATRVELDGMDALQRAAQALARQARRSLDIYSPDLEQAVYDQAEFCEAVKRFILQHRRASVRILVGDSRRARQGGHRLIHLGRRYLSRIRFRTPTEEGVMDNDAFLIADGVGLLYRHNTRYATAQLCFQAPQQARRLKQRFTRHWLLAEPDPYLRWIFL